MKKRLDICNLAVWLKTMAPFSLARAAKPEGAPQSNGAVNATVPAASVDPEPKAKIPKLSDLVVQGPRPLAPSRRPDKAEVQVCIYKIRAKIKKSTAF